jgi:hypothetical protein
MKIAIVDRTVVEPVPRGAPPPAPPPDGRTLGPRPGRNVTEWMESEEYRTILCCSIEKKSN